MFILDLYKFCEGCEWFNRQHLAKFIYTHRECDRMARCSGLDKRTFASVASKEFLARMCTLGYLDLKNGVATCYGSYKRPYGFEFRSLDGEKNKYIKTMLHIGEMSDDELWR